MKHYSLGVDGDVFDGAVLKFFIECYGQGNSMTYRHCAIQVKGVHRTYAYKVKDYKERPHQYYDDDEQ